MESASSINPADQEPCLETKLLSSGKQKQAKENGLDAPTTDVCYSEAMRRLMWLCYLVILYQGSRECWSLQSEVSGKITRTFASVLFEAWAALVAITTIGRYKCFCTPFKKEKKVSKGYYILGFARNEISLALMRRKTAVILNKHDKVVFSSFPAML